MTAMLAILRIIGLGLNTLFFASPFYIVLFFRWIIPWKRWQDICAWPLMKIAGWWIDVNDFLLWAGQPIKWDVSGLDGLTRNQWYLVSSNHQSWVDIVVLQRIFNKRIPFIKFFIKKELLWVPVIGGVWWGLDFPVMHRHSKEYLEKHPEARGQDMDTTRRMCQRFQYVPMTVLNFLEGTRFTPTKQARQQSPYRHLLRPKAGGLAFVLEAMDGKFTSLLDVTIVYPGSHKRFWDLFNGRITHIVVRVRLLPIPSDCLRGDYFNDDAFRERIQNWLATIWQEKDAQIAQILREAGS